MKNANTVAAIVLALGLVVSSWILSSGLGTLGRSIQRGAASSGSHVRIPDRMELNIRTIAPVTLGLANDRGGASLRIETTN